MAQPLVVRLKKRLLLEVHFLKLGYVVDADDRWAAVDVEPMLEAQAFECKERFISKFGDAAFGYTL